MEGDGEAIERLLRVAVFLMREEGLIRGVRGQLEGGTKLGRLVGRASVREVGLGWRGGGRRDVR